MADVPSATPALPGTEQLVVMAQRGDRAAFDRLYRDFVRVVHGIVLAHCGTQDSEDVTQDVFISAFERLRDLREPAAFPAWLCTAARRAAVDVLRQRRRRPEAAALYDIQGNSRTPAEDLADRDSAHRILALVQSLGDAYRETLVLRLVEGLSGPEIAARTGLTHGSVRVNLTRGMALLRPMLQEAGLA